MNTPHTSTFSIVARDTKTGNIAVCGGSHWFAYSTVVPFIKPGVGAVATQAECNISFGPDGLDLLEKGKSSIEVVNELIEKDSEKEIRQLLVIDKSGNTAAHTGSSCVRYALHHTEQNFAIGGNMLKNKEGIKEMTTFFHKSSLPFTEKLIKLMQMGQEIGGDIRGKRSAGMLVAKEDTHEHLWEGIVYNLRVDDHPSPFSELERIYHIAKTYKYMGKGDFYHFEKHNDKKAVFHYRKAYELSPDNNEVGFWFAKLLNDSGNKEEAEKIFYKIEKQNPMWKEYRRRVEESERK